MFYSSPGLPDWPKQRQIFKQKLSFLLISMVMGSAILVEIRIICLSKMVGSSHPFPIICPNGSETCAGGAPYDVNGGYFVNAPDLN